MLGQQFAVERFGFRGGLGADPGLEGLLQALESGDGFPEASFPAKAFHHVQANFLRHIINIQTLLIKLDRFLCLSTLPKSVPQLCDVPQKEAVQPLSGCHDFAGFEFAVKERPPVQGQGLFQLSERFFGVFTIQGAGGLREQFLEFQRIGPARFRREGEPATLVDQGLVPDQFAKPRQRALERVIGLVSLQIRPQ